VLECSNLLTLQSVSAEDPLLLPAILCFVLNKCLGRTRLSRELGIRERRARSILEKLIEMGVVESGVDKCINDSFVNKLGFTIHTRTLSGGSSTLTIISEVGDEIADLVKNRVVAVRDYIVIHACDPDALEVIGYVDGQGNIVLPRLPGNLRERYVDVLRYVGISPRSLIVLWRKYKKYFSEASLIRSLSILCSKRSVE